MRKFKTAKRVSVAERRARGRGKGKATPGPDWRRPGPLDEVERVLDEAGLAAMKGGAQIQYAAAFLLNTDPGGDVLSTGNMVYGNRLELLKILGQLTRKVYAQRGKSIYF